MINLNSGCAKASEILKKSSYINEDGLNSKMNQKLMKKSRVLICQVKKGSYSTGGHTKSIERKGNSVLIHL